MAYKNVTSAIIYPIFDYVDQNLVKSKDTTFLKKHIFSRSAQIVLAPVSVITCALDTIIGLGVGLGAISTLGKHTDTYRVSWYHLESSTQLLANPYTNLLMAINPDAKFSFFEANDATLKKNLMINFEGNGFLTHFVFEPLRDVARNCYTSDSFLKRHVSSRLTYLLLTVCCLVTRVADGIIGIPAAGLSFFTLGKFESLNNLAYRTLQATGIIEDLFYCTIKFINPLAGTY